ncbi:testis-expressed protein 10 [Nephila pilipes]|uniref:Testis-expressed protein 10 n=1 Tax=Nephila pilipes TaxID=299642 RepID=A0A8X6M7Q9_NEPPI|nr:testis-expressed protein 10 [Nephila pilipes]GFT34954.1 testis-expressed protein 10 [Nephila pilipes]GFU45618.1 testis-expressed protein 10 [Nephila pilipes]GFU52953.1 testis-expressed protein 10 [Nephila pilipes]
MLRGLSSRDANIKYDNLRKLVKYVSNNGDTLPMYFPEILKEISRLLLDSASNVREEAIELISHCVDNLTDIQFKSFFMHLTTFLICMMTHSNTDIKLNSLNLLDKLLHSHPKVMCHCGQILQSLLNMISSLKVTHGEAVKKGFGERRVLVDVMSTTMTSEEWRMKVLARIQLILQSSSTIENANEINTDDKEVHWDNKNPLFLPLYINSGAVPAKLDYSWYNEENAKLTDSNDFKQFVFDLVPLLSSALKGEVSLSSEKSSRFRIMSNSDIKHLNIITQVLFCIGECASQIFGKEGDMSKFCYRLAHYVVYMWLRIDGKAAHQQQNIKL